MKKDKLNLEKFNDLEIISSNEDNAIYRVNVPQQKNLSLQDRIKIQRNFSDTTVTYFDIDDINELKKLEDEIHQVEFKEYYKNSIFSRVIRFFDI